jgi:hypothetical protein
MIFKMDKVTFCVSLQALQMQEEHLLHTYARMQRTAAPKSTRQKSSSNAAHAD